LLLLFFFAARFPSRIPLLEFFQDKIKKINK